MAEIKNNVVVTTPTYGKFDESAITMLEDKGYEVRKVSAGGYTEEQIIEMLDENSVAIITGLEPITEKVIASAPSLKIIVKHGIGVDNIDLEAAKKLGVGVANAPGTNGDAVADLAFGLFFALARKIPQANKSVLNGEWPKVFGTGVWGKTCGIFGMGAIGKKLALRAKGMNMEVMAYDPYFDDEFAKQNGIRKAEKEEILANADFISMHLPLLDSTYGFIKRDELRLMKNSAFIVNTSRGNIINEDDLYEALKNNEIAGAALDVFASEPPKDSKLLELDNFIATPHCGGYTNDALKNTSSFVCDVVLKALSGEPVKYL